MVALEMIRDRKGELRELRAFQRSDSEVQSVESPLLMAFMYGFAVGLEGKNG